MASRYQQQTAETEQIEEVFRQKGYSDAQAYRYNSASIRVRVIDPRFAKKSRLQRERMVERVLRTLPEELQLDIIFMLTLAPDEVADSSMNFEFEHPDPYRL